MKFGEKLFGTKLLSQKVGLLLSPGDGGGGGGLPHEIDGDARRLA